MKFRLLHIIPLVMAACLAGCTDDLYPEVDTGDTDGENVVYTLQLAIDPTSPLSRGGNVVDDVECVKTYWCYGDVVTLKSGSKSYDFTISTPPGKNVGDKWEPIYTTYPLFFYSGSAITNINHFTGTIEYKSTVSQTKQANGYIKAADPTTYNNTPQAMSIYPWQLQKANGDGEHLKSINRLSATLTDVNLMDKSQVITLRPSYGVLKIVLDGFLYPLYKGSILAVRGLFPPPTGQTALPLYTMALGENTLWPTSSLPNLYSQSFIKSPEYLANSGHYPFLDVSSQTDPVTQYPLRNGDPDHKLVVYMPIFEELELAEGTVLTIGVRDNWSFDWYYWDTKPLRKFDLKFGCMYTLDLTKKTAGEYQYEPTVAICTGSSIITHIATKNIGAKSYTDPGDYIMVGHDTPLHQGDYYPNHPNGTSYWYYTTIGSVNGPKDALGKSYINYELHGGTYLTAVYELKVPYGNGDIYVGVNTADRLALGDGKDFILHPRSWWTKWSATLANMPNLLKSQWNVFHNMTQEQFCNMFYDVVTVDANGSTTNPDEPVGMRLKLPRTGHQIFVPVSGVLVPSVYGEHHTAAGEATAVRLSGTDRDCVMAGYCVYYPPVEAGSNEGKDVLLSAYVAVARSSFASQSSKMVKKHFSLDCAMPMRPMYCETPLMFDTQIYTKSFQTHPY